MIFEPSLWQEPLGSIRIDLSWTRDEGALAARLTAFPFLILSQAVVASLSSAPRSGANPSPCFSSWKINLSFQVMLSWPALCWWVKSFPSGPSWFTVAIRRNRANTSISRLRIIYKGTNQCGMWNVEQENMLLLQSLFTLYSMWLHYVHSEFPLIFWSTTPSVSGSGYDNGT